MLEEKSKKQLLEHNVLRIVRSTIETFESRFLTRWHEGTENSMKEILNINTSTVKRIANAIHDKKFIRITVEKDETEKIISLHYLRWKYILTNIPRSFIDPYPDPEIDVLKHRLRQEKN